MNHNEVKFKNFFKRVNKSPDFIKRRLNIAKLTKKQIILKDKKNKGKIAINT